MKNFPKFKKELKLIHVFSAASGAMISSGLFILPGLAYARTGPSVIVSYLIAGFLAMIGMLSQAELISAMPKAGGTYFYITRSMGPAVGAVDGLLSWLSIALKSAFALIGLGTFINMIVPVNVHMVAMGLCLLFVFLNLFQVKEEKIAVFLVFSVLAILFYYIVQGLGEVQVQYLTPFSPKGVFSVFSTAGLVFVSYGGGLLKMTSIAEEVKNPGKNLPLGMIITLLVVTLFYGLVVFVSVGVLGPTLGITEQTATVTPLTDGAGIVLGNWGAILLAVAAIFAFISTVFSGIQSASRYPFGLSRDGFLPPFLSKVTARKKIPYAAILLTGLFMVLSLLLQLRMLAKVASTVIIVSCLLSSISVIILRESKIQNYRPKFTTPLYPWTPIIGIIGYIFLLSQIGIPYLIITLILIVAAFLSYWFYGKIRSKKEYALLHLIERITNREITTGTLENELKEIIHERDEIQKDRFDHIIEKSIILDIEESVTVEGLFRLISTYYPGRPEDL
jgi:amino acid transporter